MKKIIAAQKIWLQVPADYYEKGIKNNLFQRLWHEGKWRAVSVLMSGKYKQILDVGCANGWLTSRVAKVFPKAKVFGLDVSEKMVQLAAILHPEAKFIQADAHELPFKNGSLDLIIATEVLEHVVDPLSVLLEIKRCLVPQGRVIVSLDTGIFLFNFIWFFWTKSKGRVWQNSHLHQFNIGKLRKLFSKAGFVIEKELLFNFGLAGAFRLKLDLLK